MSGLIPQSFIDGVLQQTDLVELIDSYVPLKKRGNSHIACCPFHNEKTPSFNVIAKKQFFHCFGCGASGNAISFVMSYQNLGFIDAITLLAGRLGLTIPRENDSDKKNATTDLYKLLNAVCVHYQKKLKFSGQSAIDYLRGRGVSGEIAKRYQIGYAQDGWHNLEKSFPRHQQELLTTGMLIKSDEGKIYDRYRQRIMFPIHDRHGRIIGFGGRAIEDTQKPKYLNSPETIIFQKNRELYGLYQVLSLKKNPPNIIVVEGYLDVIALAQHDVDNAVATLGTATSIYHIQLLAKHTSSIIFCFDGDNAGKQAAWRALESSLPYLDDGLDARFVFLPEGQDPDSLIRAHGKKYFLEYMDKAQPLHQLLYNTLAKDINLNNLAGKTQLINAVKPFLKKIPDGPYKQLLAEELSRRIHIESHRLMQLLNQNQSTEVLKHAPSAKTLLQRTPERVAVALLLQNPELFQLSKTQINQQKLDSQEHEILLGIIQQLAENPNATTASLIETWREHPHFEFINKLAAWDHQVPDAELLSEFLDTLAFIKKKNQEAIIHQLIDKSRQSGLSENERIQLQKLLQERHE